MRWSGNVFMLQSVFEQQVSNYRGCGVPVSSLEYSFEGDKQERLLLLQAPGCGIG